MKVMSAQLQLMFQQAIQAFQVGNFIKAEQVLRDFLCIKPNDFEVEHLLAIVYASQNKHRVAIEHYKNALAIIPGDASALSNYGSSLSAVGQISEALLAFQKALEINSYDPDFWYNTANTLCELGKQEEALSHYERAVGLNPAYFQAHHNYGRALFDLKCYVDALICYDKALVINQDYLECLINKGEALKELLRYDEALDCQKKALGINPTYAQIWSNIGNVLKELRRHDEALAHYDKALSLKPDDAEILSYKGVVLSQLKRDDEAIAHYDKALSLKPNLEWLFSELLCAKMRTCSWSSFCEYLEEIKSKVSKNEKFINPFPLLALSDDALLHKKCSEIFAEAKYPSNPTLGFILKPSKKEKIRIAYFSPDFRNHPVSFLTSELFEIHDRGRFEVFAFSLQKALIRDETNSRLRKGFDRFIDVDDMSGREIAQLARELEVDIAIDLAGPTQHARPEIFSYRAAPIQVNWLGYPGTMGADFIDYIIADKIIIPEPHQQFYVEKIVYLPNTYMVDDSKRTASTRVFTREECGLPQNAFVFCCFNNDYKFNPQVLDGWSRILLTVKNSVIWISENNERFRANITIEFEKRGIDSIRIIFAPRVDLMADHLSRYALADLFLDTHPYNAHTTALDSLKAGVPILTLAGQSFASRVAASLLNAIDLPELVTNTQEEYAALAIEFAMNPQKLADIKLKLVRNRLTTPLFDTPLFTKNIEAAYVKMYERYQADLKPHHISIA